MGSKTLPPRSIGLPSDWGPGTDLAEHDYMVIAMEAELHQQELALARVSIVKALKDLREVTEQFKRDVNNHRRLLPIVKDAGKRYYDNLWGGPDE